MDIPEHDIIVVGAGNAATCAALSAKENGVSVLQLEISPEAARGGNSAFTGGAIRIVYHGFDDLARLIPDISDHELANVDVGTYTAEQYYDDMGRLTEYRSDPDLTEILITKSFETGVWMRKKGVRFQLGLGRQAFQIDGKFKFWGGLACHIWGGGKELIKALAGRALVGRACLRLGHQRAAFRRSRCRRPLPEARLSVRHRRQRVGPALSQ